MDQPGKVASPARGQLNRKNEYFPIISTGTCQKKKKSNNTAHSEAVRGYETTIDLYATP